jgi:hypothetical protein
MGIKMHHFESSSLLFAHYFFHLRAHIGYFHKASPYEICVYFLLTSANAEHRRLRKKSTQHFE